MTPIIELPAIDVVLGLDIGTYRSGIAALEVRPSASPTTAASSRPATGTPASTTSSSGGT